MIAHQSDRLLTEPSLQSSLCFVTPLSTGAANGKSHDVSRQDFYMFVELPSVSISCSYCQAFQSHVSTAKRFTLMLVPPPSVSIILCSYRRRAFQS